MYMLYSEKATITAHRFKLLNLETAFLLEYSVETFVPHKIYMLIAHPL